MLNIMAIGDITSPRAAENLSAVLWRVRREYKLDFVAVNAENGGTVMGPTPEIAYQLLSSGADVLTGGNHTLQNNYLHAMLEKDSRLLRPLNYPAAAPGFGYTVLDAKGYRVLVMNAMGRVHMEPPLDSPFTAIERILKREEGHYDLAILDFHAEATGEKMAIAHQFDGAFSAIWGTHTHVPTADVRVLPGGTGYVTDLGMCGAEDGILGMDAEGVMRRTLTCLSGRLSPATGAVYADAVIFHIDEASGRCLSAERVRIPCPDKKQA